MTAKKTRQHPRSEDHREDDATEEQQAEATGQQAGRDTNEAESPAAEARGEARNVEPEQDEAEQNDDIAALRRDADASRDRYLRVAAEFDNYRKRTERERTESWTRAQAQLVERLLEPLDDLQRVAAVDAENTSVDSLLEGVRLVERKLLRALESAGLEPLDAEGERFDPSLHEALMMSPTETEEEDDVVGQVFQKGYRFKGNLLRPARVAVKKLGG